MIHHDLLHVIKKDRQHESFIYPYYGSYSIAEVPPSIRQWLGLPHGDRAVFPFSARHDHGYTSVLFFFIDGLGFDHFVDYEQELPFFHRLKEKSDVYPITSVFPSTTPAALTTLHTNKTPQEHGLPEWMVYFEECNEIVHPFLSEGTSPEMLYQGQTFYEELAEHAVQPYVFMKEENFNKGAYTGTTQKGSIPMPFSGTDDLLEQLVTTLTEQSSPAYYFVYWDKVDGAEHRYGPRTREHLLALHEVSSFLESVTQRLTPESTRDTLFILSSDHGQSAIRNEDIIYLNDYVDLEASYQHGATGGAIYPTGAPHDVFLHIHEPKREATIRYLKTQLDGKAEVLSTKEAVERGLYGLNQPTERFLRRVGDVLILPYEGYHVWFKHAPGDIFGQLGIHGGLSQREMIVPLAIAPLTELLK
ncbi:MAG: hypothetical protein JWL82_432 [Parcubacteria group bacterium]|nr:hypothetical protein [Parcubacteria group bacterium]